MSFTFNADEIFEIAEQIEQNGAEFYRTAAKNIDDEGKKNLLIHLAEMEDDHKKTFHTLRKQLTQDAQRLTTFDPDNMMEEYLRSLADTRVFYEKKISMDSLKEILLSALSTEKDSIVFYLGIKEIVPPHLGQEKLDDIIKEEMEHINLLTKELLALQE